MTERLSDTFKAAPLTCYVLLSEPLKASFDEILDAADEDFPGMNWGYQAPEDNTELDTRKEMTLSDTTGTITFTCGPGRLEQDWTEEMYNSRLFFPRAADALADHTDYIRISIKGRVGKTSRDRRLRLARQLICLSSVFANLPIATAIYVPSAEKLVRPALWVEATDPENADEVPILQWITVGIREYNDDEGAPVAVSAYTVGLAPFLGQEFVLPRIKCPGAEAEVVLSGIVSLAFEQEQPYEDGEEMGFSAWDKSFRVRYCPEGTHDAPTDQVWYLHKSCDINDRKLLGKTERERSEEVARTNSAKFRSELAHRVVAKL
ncbi:MAG: hypothetical protein AAFX07_16675 [Pseudomonadota bacterium]